MQQQLAVVERAAQLRLRGRDVRSPRCSSPPRRTAARCAGAGGRCIATAGVAAACRSRCCRAGTRRCRCWRPGKTSDRRRSAAWLRLAQASGDLAGALLGDEFVEHDHEGVAGPTRDGVAQAHDADQAPADLAQESSVAVWPSVSTSCLKRIRSRQHRRPAGCGGGRAATAMFRRSSSRLRFGRPVSRSCGVWKRSYGFERAPLGDVAADREQVRAVAGGERRSAPRPAVRRRAAAVVVSMVSGPAASAVVSLASRAGAAADRAAHTAALLARVAEVLAAMGVDVGDAAGGVDDDEGVGGLVDDLPQPLFCIAAWPCAAAVPSGIRHGVPACGAMHRRTGAASRGMPRAPRAAGPVTMVACVTVLAWRYAAPGRSPKCVVARAPQHHAMSNSAQKVPGEQRGGLTVASPRSAPHHCQRQRCRGRCPESPAPAPAAASAHGRPRRPR